MVDTTGQKAFLDCIPPTLVSTLKALKYDDKLSALLDDYLKAAPASSSSEEAFATLEKKAKPILVDIGAGKKGVIEIFEAWKAIPVGQAEKDKAGSSASDESSKEEDETHTGSAKDTTSSSGVTTSTGQTSSESKSNSAGAGPSKIKERKARKKGAAAAAGNSDATPEWQGLTPTAPTTAAPEGYKLSSLLNALPPIHATSQESRFFLDDIVTNTQEVDLKTVNISIGEKELLVDAHLRLKQGVHYALVGRNGSGKSTLLRALGDRLIPGLPPRFSILLVSQVENELFMAEVEGGDDKENGTSASVTNEKDERVRAGTKGQAPSTLRCVLLSDKARVRATQEADALSKVMEEADAVPVEGNTGGESNVLGSKADLKLAQVVAYIHLARKRDELEEAKRFSLRRSGARGADARKALIQAEKDFEEAKAVQKALAGADAEESKDASSNATTGTVSLTDLASRDWRGEAADLFTEAQNVLEDLEASTAEARCETILKGLGFCTEQIHGPYKNLSGGWKSRASLASALLKHADCLILDEPSNYLDLPAVLFLQRFIQESSKTVIVVSHDRELVDNIAEELIVLRKQQLTYFDGNLSEYETTQRRKMKSAMKQQAALDKKKEHIEKSIAEGARQAKKHGDDNKMRMVKSRQKKLDDRWGAEVNAKGHRFKLNRDMIGYFLTHRSGVDIDMPDPDINFHFFDPEPLRFPGPLVHLDDVTLQYPGASRPSVSNVTLTIHEGERVALVGANGHGKSTTVNLIMERLKPSKGSIERHSKATIRYYDQHTIEQFAQLARQQQAEAAAAVSAGQKAPPVVTALSHFLHKVAEGDEAKMAGLEARARRFLGALGLKGRTADAQPLWTLSGGQAVRLGLAEVMWDEPHLVCLDEVTQHLDADSIDALIRALRNFSGAILLVSHDRHAVKQLVEGKKSEMEGSSDEEGGASDVEEEYGNGTLAKEPGRVYWVHEGKFTLLQGGMDSYVARVEKEIQT